MALSYTEKTRWRKLIYAGIIVALFSLMFFHRRTILETAASTNDLRVHDLGDVDLGGSAVQYALVSFRGPLVCGLWWEASERQARHEWDKLELLMRSLTKLQPHFPEPWKYQGWNLSYNVSVEFDRHEDKYFYIAEGVQWLVEGERMTRARIYDPEKGTKKEVGDADLRWYIGFVMQNKMTVADEAKFYRCFFQLSCMQPKEWDPGELDRNPAKLEEFKQRYPQLVRRIKELRRVPDGAPQRLNQELLTIFRTYRGIPSRYAEPVPGQVGPAPLKEDLKQFPLWPKLEKDYLIEGEPKRKVWPPPNTDSEPEQNPYEIALAWYEFSQESLPEPGEDDYRKDRRFRWPKSAMLIFRSHPARAKCRQAMDLAEEGFFQESQEAWKWGHYLWLAFGQANSLDPDDYPQLQQQARLYRVGYPELSSRNAEPPATLRNPALDESYRAHVRLSRLDGQRNLPRYGYWKTVSAVSMTDQATDARRHFHRAQQQLMADLTLAQREYEEGAKIWKKLLVEKTPEKPPLHFPGHLVALFGFAAESGPAASYLFKPTDFFELTPFGEEQQVQREILEMQDHYLRLRAKAQMPQRLIASKIGTEVGSGFMKLYGLPTGHAPVTVDTMELFLERQPGPLDRYLDQSLRRLPESLAPGDPGRGRRGLFAPPQPTPTAPPPDPTKPPENQ